MRWTPRTWTALAAMSGFIAVAAGAFAAHGMADPTARDLLRTGSAYEMYHALAALACAASVVQRGRKSGSAAASFLAGSALFSGSLYALAFGAPRWTGLLTPLGGLLFLLGWALLAWGLLDRDRTG